MTNSKRIPYSEKIKARCREMRELGYSSIQITEATRVPGSTIARWAAEGGWRVCDVAEELLPELTEDEPAGRLIGLGGMDWGGASGGSDPAGEKGADDAPPKSRQERLDFALERALDAAGHSIDRGSLVQAEKAARLAGSLSRTMEKLKSGEDKNGPKIASYTAADIATAREELTRRLDKLAASLDARVEDRKQRFLNGELEDPDAPRWEIARCVLWAQRMGWLGDILAGRFDASGADQGVM